MEQAGWVTRERCESDARGQFAVMTDAGWGLIVRAAPVHVESVRRRLLDVLGDDFPEFGALCERVAEPLVNHCPASAPRWRRSSNALTGVEGLPPLTVASALTPIRASWAVPAELPPMDARADRPALAILRNGIPLRHRFAGLRRQRPRVAGAAQLVLVVLGHAGVWPADRPGRASKTVWNTGYLIAALAVLILACLLVLLRNPAGGWRSCSRMQSAANSHPFRHRPLTSSSSPARRWVALGRRWWLVVIGALIATSANPEQSIVASLCLLLVAGAPRFRAKRRDALIFFGIAVVNWVGVTLWFSLDNVDGSRALLFPVWIAKSLQGFVEAFR